MNKIDKLLYYVITIIELIFLNMIITEIIISILQLINFKEIIGMIGGDLGLLLEIYGDDINYKTIISIVSLVLILITMTKPIVKKKIKRAEKKYHEELKNEAYTEALIETYKEEYKEKIKKESKEVNQKDEV